MHVTTPFTLKDDLRRSLAARGVDAGTTVGDFLNALMALGVELDMPLGSIEFGVSQHGCGRVAVEVTEGVLEVREVTR